MTNNANERKEEDMKIEHNDNGKKGSWYIKGDDGNLAEMTYTWAGEDRFIIDHTEVDDELRGMGVGQKMVEESVTFARERDVKIIPLCPFAKSVFDKNKEYADVL